MGSNYNLTKWTLIASLVLCCCCCYESQASIASSKIAYKKAYLSKEHYQKHSYAKSTTAKSPPESLEDLKEANANLHEENNSSEESTTNICKTFTINENEKNPLEKDLTSTASLSPKDVTSLEHITTTTTKTSMDGSSSHSTTAMQVKTDLTPTSTMLASEEKTTTTERNVASLALSRDKIPCTCGIFLGSQIKKNNKDSLKGEAVITNTLSRTYSCDGVGQKHCQTKCLEQIVQHLPNSGKILCASLDRDIRKEKAYLFIKNCSNKWINTNLAAGREYCCKNREPYSCK